MKTRSITIIALAAMLATTALAGCTRDQGNERWATTSNTTVEIDWDKVQEAYREANGPQDFEQRVNEIYEGDELVSVAVQDQDAKTQVVTGFFDKNANGKVEEEEKIFELQRDIVGEDQAQYQARGYGHYAGYRHTTMWDIAGGVMIGSMLANAFSPGYRPMYATPYTTSTSRRSQIRNHRTDYRAKNPSRFSRPSKASGSGRSYGSKGKSWGTRSSGSSGRRSFGGGGFGIDSQRRKRKRVIHLDA